MPLAPSPSSNHALNPSQQGYSVRPLRVPNRYCAAPTPPKPSNSAERPRTFPNMMSAPAVHFNPNNGRTFGKTTRPLPHHSSGRPTPFSLKTETIEGGLSNRAVTTNDNGNGVVSPPPFSLMVQNTGNVGPLVEPRRSSVPGHGGPSGDIPSQKRPRSQSLAIAPSVNTAQGPASSPAHNAPRVKRDGERAPYSNNPQPSGTLYQSVQPIQVGPQEYVFRFPQVYVRLGTVVQASFLSVSPKEPVEWSIIKASLPGSFDLKIHTTPEQHIRFQTYDSGEPAAAKLYVIAQNHLEYPLRPIVQCPGNALGHNAKSEYHQIIRAGLTQNPAALPSYLAGLTTTAHSAADSFRMS